jgi:hypothetical protein
MTRVEELLLQIEELREAIRVDREKLDSVLHREEEREQVRNHLSRCQKELKVLTERFLAGNDRPG